MTTPRRRQPARSRPEQQALSSAEDVLPFGLLDVHPTLITDKGPPLRHRCVINGCPHYLIPPTRKTKGQACPIHGIRVHTSATYSYKDATRNAILDRDLLQRIIRHPGKFESWRMGNERSEDCLTFNVFRSFQQAGCLNVIGRLITGLEVEAEPQLFLWSLTLTDDSLTPWPQLVAARSRFERSLPVNRPATEPDVGLLLDGVYLALIECKLGSPNTFYTEGERKDAQSLTKSELLTIYHDRQTSRILDLEKAKASEAVAYQMWRNTVFSEWMAAKSAPGTRAYFTNLVRAGSEIESFEHFFQLVRPEYAGRVTRVRWEDLFILASIYGNKLLRLRRYLAEKTLNLRPAFQLIGV
ncbi:MAG: hypothetical protein K2W96_23555 [Gemmataceae bacterium]|nr:hypothetical protein [Gemmataceae bacterium]